MNTDLIIRAWKDPEFRARLSAEERDSLPDMPSGAPMTELDEGALRDIVGGKVSEDLGGSTGCVGPYRPTCGIVMCPIRELEF
ncbi:mersacidin/lichenicidin family type 2 lantibiotic [Hyalangium versicolor]|uniref:mersacidin/lichenicidin family type 2 lantibiotic n=1 Tax=Hyalangium versicolor TaxID=2861190 RepID=UPI001CCAA0B4|nr:mersacidin/lichenicidin family type 2 lantibiotic [Hyalangium versicolor]